MFSAIVCIQYSCLLKSEGFSLCPVIPEWPVRDRGAQTLYCVVGMVQRGKKAKGQRSYPCLCERYQALPYHMSAMCSSSAGCGTPWRRADWNVELVNTRRWGIYQPMWNMGGRKQPSLKQSKGEMRHVTVPLQLKGLILRGAEVLAHEPSQSLWFPYCFALLLFVFFFFF